MTTIRGRLVSAATRSAVAGEQVEAWSTDRRRKTPLAKAKSDANGAFALEFATVQGAVSFRVFRDGKQVLDTFGTTMWTPDQGDRLVVIAVPDPHDESRNGSGRVSSVTGTVATELGVAGANLKVEIWDHNVGGATRIASTTTDGNGKYALLYDPASLHGKTAADLEVRVLDPARRNAVIASSSVMYQAAASVAFDPVVDAAHVARAPEFMRLHASIEPLLGQTPLARVGATGVIYLAERSGWDARAVAMAAQAARISDDTGIPVEHCYALLRTGAPGDGDNLHRFSDAQVKSALALAQRSGIIDSRASIDKTVKLHAKQAAKQLLEVAPPTAVSTLGDILSVGLAAADRSTFLDVYRNAGDDPAALWQGLAKAGFSERKIAKLRATSALGRLTMQNAPLVGRLMQEQRIRGLDDLASNGFHAAEKWVDVIGDSVPAGLTRDAYAAGLAAQVRIAAPTLVAADLVRNHQVALDGATDAVVAFLADAHGTHTIGDEPMYRWEGFNELDDDGKAGARLVERLWQISPSNESMAALARIGIRSAKEVAGYRRQDFLAQHGDEFPSEDEALMVHDKATQVHTTALSLATAYLAQRSMPNVYVLSGTTGKPAPAKVPVGLADAGADDGADPGAGASATLEDLFQNMDYCACEECNSVFGPAAYLVELLEFLDLTGTPHDLDNPIDVLRGRRPDLEHIQLSCENTNVALPYVDLVNEILEYYVVNGNLTDFAGHDMTSASNTADLLADPQYVQDAAYDETVAGVYPWWLPFDRPLAKLRLLFGALGTTLPDALSVVGDPAGARRERLGLNGAEYRILTEVGFHALPEYFGQPPAASIDDLNNAVANGKVFCRTVDIAYEELAEILGARFVNPGAPLVSLLEDLKVELAKLQDWYDGNLTNAQLDALLPAGLDPAAYGGDVHAWLTANRALIMGLITLTDVSAEPVECDFAEVELRYALPDQANNRLDEIAYLRLNRFIRLWRKLGQSVELTDRLVTTFLGLAPEDLTPANIDETFKAMLARLANFEVLIAELSVSRRALPDWLSLWDPTLDPTVRSDRLAGLLRAGTVDMASLIAITGIDPFADDLDADEPSILRFARAWREVKASPLKVTDLDYLLRHQDSTGRLEPSDDELLREVKALRDAMTAVDADLGAAAQNPDLNATRAKMALVYDDAVVARLFALIGHTTTYAAPFVTTEETLPAPLAAVQGIDFDPFAKQLTYVGVMSAAAKTALDAAADALVVGDLAPGTTPAQRDAFVAAFKASVQTLSDEGAADLAALAADYPELAAVFTAADAVTDPAAKSAAVLDAILPELRDGLKTLALRTTLTAITRADATVVDAITSGEDVLHADGDPAHGVLADFRGLEETIALNADGTFDLLIDPPATADYILYVAAPETTQVTLSLGGTDVIPATAVGASGEVATAVEVALTAGALTDLQLTLAGLPAGKAAQLRWRTKAIAETDVPASGLYAKAATDTSRASLIRIEKVTLLEKALGLTPGELSHVAAVETNTKGVLDDLDTDGSIADAALHALWAKVERLIWFTRLKADHEPDPDTFLSIFQDPGRTTPQGKLVVAGVMEWDETDLADVLAHRGLTQADLAHLDDLRTVARTLDLVATTAQPAADVLAWAVADPNGALLTSAQQALHSRMTDASWRDLMQGVNDPLRNQSRDALVAYILFHDPPDPAVKTPDDLYQHFLVDVQMDSCMQTSRIRLALSTVQLFIARCLINLEPDVSPGSIRADRWAWMQRYRVWEANRRVFVFPENWLEPELRDNKSPFFTELESELLKSDITDDAAEEAYLSYLKKLDDVAKLEIVGAFLHQQHPGHPDEDVLHVFGRTNGITRTYYSRRFEYGYWTPWEKMPLNIDGDMVVPVVWKSQLFVFWATSVQKKNDGNGGSETAYDVAQEPWTTRAQFSVEVTLNWGEYYRGKWTSPKSSEMTDPLRITGLGTYDQSKLVITAHTEQPGGNLSERLVMPVLYFGGETAAFLVTFTSKHSPPLVETQTSLEGLLLDPVKVFNWKLFWEGQSAGVLDSNSLRLSDRTMEAGVEQPALAKTPRKSELVLTKSGSLLNGFRVRPLMHPIDNQWNAPFFYSDEQSVFSVEAREVIWDDTWLDVFYDNGPSPVYTIDHIPPVYETPVIPNRGDPVINPWETSVNPNFKTIIKDNVAFHFDGAVFDAGGLRVAGIGGGFH